MLKDYYQILEVPPDADREMIKKSFRKLAHRFHPDKNRLQDTYTDARYREIQEAYRVLSDPEQRAAYDDERWLSGRLKRSKQQVINAEYLAAELRRLDAFLHQTDVHRMNREALAEYLYFLLRDEHIGILNAGHNPAANEHIIRHALHAAGLLPYYFSKGLYPRLAVIQDMDEALREQISLEAARQQQRENWRRLMPWLLLLATLLLCAVIFLLSRKR